MKSLLVFPVLILALTFCNLGERLKSLTGGGAGSANTGSSTSPQGGGDKNIVFERPELSDAQKALTGGGKEIKWDEQGMTWRVPQEYKQLSKDRYSFNWMGADNAVLLVNISAMSADFPVDASIKAYYDSQVAQMKNGEIESVRYLEIDGVKGVEFIQAKADNAESPRRHHWIAYRKYAGQSQMLNFILSVKDGAFDKHRNELAAILYSTQIINQE